MDASEAYDLLVQAHTLLDMGKYEDSLAVYRKVVAQYPDRVDIWGNIGIALQRLGCLNEALDAYARTRAGAGFRTDLEQHRKYSP